ncbi:MAG TPA: DNA polymerase III subunit alpha [Alteromonas australica]|jgi:DNA polymerase-3 subunit alpha|uniref:DNA polymerase III subunit alpha n=1 Tax=Alteromonas australica TaxID=589873 RepID=A0A353JGF9_9ALTE|nr:MULTISPECIES: DNA polymerase III subunit alpha [Alteromonas]MAF71326.1 DNA polymerase III subunit alpha [Alteromonas sp.]MAO29584.1 DNA polymerase III subunit alpha [Alteromonas sp.]MBU32513.1 DNA polymerase III subunit alpha [Alteromonas sp.]QPL49182.1 DNA polymerase III subunit alpha [Alteromonas sp. B31-7]HAI72399.1 DNA polymerase III subunit alpha [Alteromonas australica]|tara:strand:- start:13493 stop:16957 length:3465 start_codon:yes stop_codon:yes gene_type:complete
MSSPFIHLRVHSDFSMMDGLNKVKPILNKVAELNMPAVAITDQMNMCGLVKFYSTAHDLGIKPIIGTDFWVTNDIFGDEPFRLTLLAMNNEGYKNITILISKAYLRGHVAHKAVIDQAWLAEHSEGVIILSGGLHGDLGVGLTKNNKLILDAALQFYQTHFEDRFYLELTRTGRNGEEEYLHRAVALAEQEGLPVVATNEVCFIDKAGFDAHEIRVCIHDGYTLDDNRRPKRYSEQQYLRSAEEMLALFSDIPEAIENTVEIAKRCNVTVRLGEYFLPQFPTGGMTTEDFLVKVSEEGLEDRLEFLFPDENERKEKRPAYDDRLRIELEVINQMGFPGYFLIVMEFIQWSKDNGIPVGPGRGSGAGSLVAYALKITDLDPLEFDLLFERFLNPERVSMPDFDVDFCMDRRDEVIDHVAELYGRQAVSQIITFGTMAAKAVVRDVGRVLGHPYGFVDRISKLIPPDPGMTLEKAFAAEPQLPEVYEQDEEVKDLIDMARILEGVTRNAGKHAGGVVIAPTTITDFSPLYCDDEGKNPVTQFDKNDVETAGLVKFDFLGLRTLTIIQWAIDMIKEGKNIDVDIAAIPLEDKRSFKTLQNAETTAVFQLESRGMKELIKRLKPDCFEDIIALVALFRPGPLQSGMVDNFIDRKHGREEISYPDAEYQHECLKEILEPTYGIILYQEQVMQIAQEMAGYSLGGADLLRRAMGKKKPEEMAKQRGAFAEGSKNNNIDPDLAMKIFDLVEKFAGYGFNKSHSAAYALVSYQTLWLKVHYPAEFMAAVMSADMDNTDKIVTLVDECDRMGLEILPPDLNAGKYKFTVDSEGRIVYGIGAIKGVGEGPIEAIIEARETQGAFKDLFDFCAKIDVKRVNKRVLEKLVLSGAMDNLGPHRAALMATLPEAIAAAGQHAKAESFGQSDMFGLLTTEPEDVLQAFADVPQWPEKVWLEGEKDTLGLYLTGHPINQYADEIRYYTEGRLVDLKPTGKDQMASAVGLVLGVRVMTNKRGRRWAIVTLDDKSARIDVRFFPDMYEQFESVLETDKILLIKGQVSFDDFSGGNTITARDVMDIVQAREKNARALALYVDTQVLEQQKMSQLQSILQAFNGGSCPVQLAITHPDVEATLACSAKWYVTPEDQLLHDLKQCLGEKAVSILYH